MTESDHPDKFKTALIALWCVWGLLLVSLAFFFIISRMIQQYAPFDMSEFPPIVRYGFILMGGALLIFGFLVRWIIPVIGRLFKTDNDRSADKRALAWYFPAALLSWLLITGLGFMAFAMYNGYHDLKLYLICTGLTVVALIGTVPKASHLRKLSKGILNKPLSPGKAPDDFSIE